MNPILLKPNSGTGAQVIVQGRPLTNMDADAYHDYKATAMAAVLASWRRLCQQYDYLIIEGAGSPAEINLRAGDIANMGFAEAVDCPVILIADIDRGGVFAHLVGTLALLSASEQARVNGFVINRFRDDIKLLEPGLEWLEERTGKPVLGILPYLHGLDLDAEDALDTSQHEPATDCSLKIRVPALPHISNHTDFDPLRRHPQVDFEYVGPIGLARLSAEEIAADLIVLPGSKNVRGDLQWLEKQGWPAAIDRHLRYGGRLLGICGGLQMLGTSIDDTEGVEGAPGDSLALGYLDLQTTLQLQKTLTTREGVVLGMAPIRGYEIHSGVSHGPALSLPLIHCASGDDGALSADGQIAATYWHGLFDQADACAAFLQWAGLDQVTEQPDVNHIRENELNRLADCLEQQLDWTQLDKILAP